MTREESWLLQEKWNGNKTEGFFTDCIRLESGEPLAYVIGHTPFLGCTIHLDSHPLIPRPETEFWVQEVISEINKKSLDEIYLLDLCAGSGCIGVSVLAHIPNAHVDFVEIDVSHHSTIQKNIDANTTDQKRTKIIGGNLFDTVTDQYDYILTNPPYIDPQLDRIETSVREYEPHLALYGGDAGLSIINEIIHNAQNSLKSQGKLIIEHEPEQTHAIGVLAETNGFVPTNCKDQYGVYRFTHLTRKA